MLTALMVLLGLLALVLLLLAMPVHLAFRIERDRVLEGEIDVAALLGLARFRVPIPRAGRGSGRADRTDTPGGPDVPEADQRHGRRRARRRNFIGVLRRADLRRRAWRFARDLLAATHLHRLEVHARLGLGDPADTGRLWALVGPLGALAANLRHADVRIEPAFMDAVLELRASGRLRLVPLQFLALTLGFALSPPALRAWRTLGRERG